MTLLTEGRVRAAAQRSVTALRKSYETVLAEARLDSQDGFDIFLSHSIKDAEIVIGTRSVLMQFGLTVYVDWIEDKDIDRTKVSPVTARHLKRRMRQCKSLVYLATENSGGSKWMPWELGFFDGRSGGRVAVLPVSPDKRETFAGQEYLGIYPYVDTYPNQDDKKETLWVSRSIDAYTRFDVWLEEGPSSIKKVV